MSDIKPIIGWRTPVTMGAAYEKLLAALGTDKLGSTVQDAVVSATAGVRRLYLFEATSRESSTLQYSFCEPEVLELLPSYRRWYLGSDPIGDAFCAAPKCSDMAVQRVRPADIRPPEFRRRFFEEAGIVERVSIIQRGVDSWRGINVARHASIGYCSDEELSSLIGLACLVLPMLPLNRTPSTPRERPTVAELERRFALRCASLSHRERQVCARAATGMSVEATADDLGVAKTSVLTYRQRAYQRLRIASPVELCALVMH